jgi:hypothetical protein
VDLQRGSHCAHSQQVGTLSGWGLGRDVQLLEQGFANLWVGAASMLFWFRGHARSAGVSCSLELVNILETYFRVRQHIWHPSLIHAFFHRTHLDRKQVSSMEIAALNLPILLAHTCPHPPPYAHTQPPSSTPLHHSSSHHHYTTSPATTTHVGACANMRANTFTREPKPNRLPMCDVNLAAEARARDLVSRMTLAEKGRSEDCQHLIVSEVPLVAPAADACAC